MVRRIFDQQYCSTEHRREARLASAQALRDEEESEVWSVARSRDKRKNAGRPPASAGQTASIFAFLTVGGLLVAALMLPGPSTGGGPSAFPQLSADNGKTPGLFQRAGDAIGGMIRSSAPITLHHDFGSGLADWASVNLHGTNFDDPRDWIGSRPPLAHVSLRLWNKSTSLQNYQMEFLGQMEKKSLSWAFRASGADNYYATKLLITKPGPQPNASILRYAMINGHEFDRAVQPIPITLQKGINYNVRVTVQDDRFLTYLNGQLISTWMDKRLLHGGVGFFEDESDPQKVAWVSVSERDSLLGRMLAHFSFFVPPTADLQ